MPLDFAKEDNEIIKEIKALEPNNMTPIMALNTLYLLKEKVKKSKF